MQIFDRPSPNLLKDVESSFRCGRIEYIEDQCLSVSDASPKPLVHSGHGDRTKAANHSVKIAKNEEEKRVKKVSIATATVDLTLLLESVEFVNC